MVGGVDFSGELQLTMESMGIDGGDNLDINVALYPSWDFGLDISSMVIDFRMEQKTYTRHEVCTEVMHEATVPVSDSHLTLSVPREVCDRIDGQAPNCTLCCHVSARIAGINKFFMHKAPYVVTYVPCRYAKR